ncbi:MAG: hypothetical protein NT062_34275 [Proteobacteria bacterium]|nr:hypothetical protein [Pseudomonadota bacterium]
MVASLLAVAACNKTEPAAQDVAEAQKKLVTAVKLDLAQARVELEATAADRMTKLDAKLVELDQKTDEVKAKLALMADRTETNWDAFKTDVVTSWDLLAKDVDAAIK